MRLALLFRSGLTLATAALIAVVVPARAAEPTVQDRAKQTWQLLDYVAVDYGGAVSHGTVLKASEYAEMQEFSAAAEEHLRQLPRTEVSERLQQQAGTLRRAVSDKAEPATVAEQAHRLAAEVLKAYPFPTSPNSAPDLGRGARSLGGRRIEE